MNRLSKTLCCSFKTLGMGEIDISLEEEWACRPSRVGVYDARLWNMWLYGINDKSGAALQLTQLWWQLNDTPWSQRDGSQLVTLMEQLVICFLLKFRCSTHSMWSREDAKMCSVHLGSRTNTHLSALWRRSECLPVGRTAGGEGGQSSRGSGAAQRWEWHTNRHKYTQPSNISPPAPVFHTVVVATSSHISPTHTHIHMWWWAHTSFPVALVLISRSICTRQEITTSLAHINMSLLSFPQCPCVYMCVCRERAMNGDEAWIRLFKKFPSLTVCNRGVCV